MLHLSRSFSYNLFIKNISPKRIFFLWWPLVLTVPIRLTANRRTQIDSGDAGPSFGYLTILLASIVIEIIAIFCENSPILRKFDLFDLFYLKFHLIKKWSVYFCRTCRGLSNAVYRFSLSILVFEFSWGGGVAVIRLPRPCEGGSDPRPCAG